MNITRNNYEEYFLLYADGELNAIDKQAVETFVTLHPDLADELEMLMDTVLIDENIKMPGKEFLLKPELVSEEIISPQQEAMLMMLDNELGNDASQKLQKEIAADKNLQFEWSILQQTKLLGGAVAMPGKEELYRHEKDRKPIPIFGYARWIAAAAVVAGIGWFGLNFLNNNSGSSGTVATVGGKPQTKVQPVVISPSQTEPSVINNQPAVADKINKENTGSSAVTDVAVNQNQGTKKPDAKPLQKQIQEPVNEVPVRQYAVNKSQPVINTIDNPVATENTIASIDNGQIEPIAIKNVSDNNEAPAVVVTNTIYKEENINDETEYVNIAGAHIKKQKLRGVFRNVTRTIGRGFDKSNVAQADVASLR